MGLKKRQYIYAWTGKDYTQLNVSIYKKGEYAF